MLKVYVDMLEELIQKGEIKKGDAIIDETKERLIDYMYELSPSASFKKIHIEAYVNKVFDDRFGM